MGGSKMGLMNMFKNCFNSFNSCKLESSSSNCEYNPFIWDKLTRRQQEAVISFKASLDENGSGAITRGFETYSIGRDLYIKFPRKFENREYCDYVDYFVMRI